MTKGLLVTISIYQTANKSLVKSLMFTDMEQGRRFVAQNETYVIHTQVVDVVPQENKHG